MTTNTPKVRVYKDGELVSFIDLPQDTNFEVVENDKRGLYWEIPPDSEEIRRRRKQKSGEWGGVLMLFYQNKRFVWGILDKWELRINGVRYEQASEFRRRCAIKWPKVELLYLSFRFEFLFPEFEETKT